MRKLEKLVLIVASLTAAIAFAEGEGLRFLKPAEDSLSGWKNSSLPLGNGWFGANVFGLVDDERVQISHNAALAGQKGRDGKLAASVTSALDLRFRFDGEGEVTDYSRTLDFATATAFVRYSRGGVRFVREYFASHPDKVLVMRFSADHAGTLGFFLRAEVPCLGEGRKGVSTALADSAVLDTEQEIAVFGERISSCARVVTDGKVTATGAVLRVSGASEAVVCFALDTNYKLDPAVFLQPRDRKRYTGADPRAEIDRRVERAVEKGFAAVRRDHIADFAALYGRVSLSLPGAEADRGRPTDELVRERRGGRASAWLEQCVFQYGRYLLVSSSRKGALPANLQGIWNAIPFAPWGGGYFHNVNVQMNYWPAFAGNLCECFEAYADYNRALRPNARRLAETCLRAVGRYDADEPLDPDAWCMGVSSSAISSGGPNRGSHSGPGVVGFTTALYVDWWEFTHDRALLEREIYPAIRGGADFLSRIVAETNGHFLAVVSASPEQKNVSPTGKLPGGKSPAGKYYQALGCAFDQQMIDENSRAFLRFHHLLGRGEDALTARVRAQVGRYNPLLIGADGQLKEFREEHGYGEIGETHHRHISHLVALYPGSGISVETPEYLKAACVTLDRRGDLSTAWGMAHRMCCWARARDGERAYRIFGKLQSYHLFDNLWSVHKRVKPGDAGTEVFQIDANFGVTAGMIEMLVQSKEGEVTVLPALPKVWAKSGSFSGLRVRGGWTLDCEWRDGKPVRVELRPCVATPSAKPKIVKTKERNAMQ